MRNFFRMIVFLLFLIAIGCDHGLEPPNPALKKTGISGTITFTNWPDSSSLFDLRLVAFKNFPPEDIFTEVSEERAVVYPPITEGHLPFYVDDIDYVMELEPGTIGYLMVAHQHKPAFLDTASWQAVGQYDTTPADSMPTPIVLEKGQLLTGIDIAVDFNRLPMQPF